ncbi:MAG: hypothetical protein ACK4R8_08840 [Thiobacillus sp.]
MSATVLVVLDMTIVNVAMPHMAGALGATQEENSWVLTSYLSLRADLVELCGDAALAAAAGWHRETARFHRDGGRMNPAVFIARLRSWRAPLAVLLGLGALAGVLADAAGRVVGVLLARSHCAAEPGR